LRRCTSGAERQNNRKGQWKFHVPP
jgi:hypothetical protein